MRTDKSAVIASLPTLLLSLFSLFSSNDSIIHAFQLPSSSLAFRGRHLNMAAEMSEVEKLRAAAAQAREDYERLRKEAGKQVEIPPSQKSLSLVDLQSLASTINFLSPDATQQVQTLDTLVRSGSFSLWKSATTNRLRPFSVSLSALESRTDGKVTGSTLGIAEDSVQLEDFQYLTLAVVLGSTALGIAALALLPPNLGATLCYLLALIPIGFIGVGSVAPGVISGLIQSIRGDNENDGSNARVSQRDRMSHHEAGHFLCGYLCGLPVKSYQLPLQETDGVACVEFHSNENGDTAMKGEFSEKEIAALSVVAMSGSVAEIVSYGKATGGRNDLMELQNCFRRSKEFIGAAKQQDLTRWGALTAYSLIKGNMGSYEKLVEAFLNNKSLSDCVAIIEASASSKL